MTLTGLTDQLQEKGPRIVAQVLAARTAEFLKTHHCTPEDSAEFKRWISSLPPIARSVLRWSSYTANGVVHAIPNGESVLSLFPAEVLADVFKQAGLAVAGVDEQIHIINQAIPLMPAAMAEETKKTSGLTELLKRVFGSLDELNKELDGANDGIERMREGIRKRRAQERAKGWRRFVS